LGTIVHEAIAGAGRRRQEGRRTTEDDLQDLYQDAWDGTALAEPRRRPVLEALGWTWLERLWRQGGLDGCPTQVEAPFAVDLDGWTLRGVIDRVEVDEAGRARIVDFKTGRRLPASELRRDLQLALYAVGARSGLGLGRSPVGSSPLTLDLVYLRTGERVSLQPEPALLERAQAIGREVAERVQEGAFEARPSARRCRVCPYRLACPSGQ
jgi:RecB family exonuclease